MFANISKLLSRLSAVGLILALRSISIIVQTSLVLTVIFALHYDLPVMALLIVISLEVVFNALCFFVYRRHIYSGDKSLLLQLLADVGFLTALLYFSGGATNAFVSLLLIPIAISAVVLPFSAMLTVTLSAIFAYSMLLWALPMSVMHGNMQGHFIGMWMNFLFSSLVVVVVVGQLAKMIATRETTIAKYREEQLKRERIMALGVASAQVTHDLATPLTTLQLLLSELSSSVDYNDELINDINRQVQYCSANLHRFRTTAEQIKNNEKQSLSCEDVFAQIRYHCQLNYPEIAFDFQPCEHAAEILADGSLLPAIVNIIDNAVTASRSSQQNQITIQAYVHQQQWHFSVTDFAGGFVEQQIAQLGYLAQDSELGLGISILLTNASIERMGGQLTLTNHPEGARVSLHLPLLKLGAQA